MVCRCRGGVVRQAWVLEAARASMGGTSRKTFLMILRMIRWARAGAGAAG